MMISEFLPAVQFVLSNEGGYCDNPSDPGGATNFGITQRMWVDYLMRINRRIDIKNVRDITKTNAIDVYKTMFWDLGLYSNINCQKLCNYVFDMVINHGQSVAIKLVQRALWAINHKYHFIDDDGVLGNRTLDEINHASSVLLPPLIAERACLYRRIVDKDQSQEIFLNGWLNRCYRTD